MNNIKKCFLCFFFAAIGTYFGSALYNNVPIISKEGKNKYYTRKYQLRESYYIAGNSHEESAVYNSEAACKRERDLFLNAKVNLPEGNREAYCIPEPIQEAP